MLKTVTLSVIGKVYLDNDTYTFQKTLYQRPIWIYFDYKGNRIDPKIEISQKSLIVFQIKCSAPFRTRDIGSEKNILFGGRGIWDIFSFPANAADSITK